MDHTLLYRQITPRLPFVRKHSPDCVTWPERMRSWVGLVGWPIADGLPTWVVTHWLQVECRTGKFAGVKTDVLPLSYAASMAPKSWGTRNNILPSTASKWHQGGVRKLISVDGTRKDIHPTNSQLLKININWSISRKNLCGRSNEETARRSQ